MARFPKLSGMRQVYELTVQMVLTSCGFGVPHYDFVQERSKLQEALAVKEEEGMEHYWKRRNAVSLNGKNTGITVD